jgi:hypothetical protein
MPRQPEGWNLYGYFMNVLQTLHKMMTITGLSAIGNSAIIPGQFSVKLVSTGANYERNGSENRIIINVCSSRNLTM